MVGDWNHITFRYTISRHSWLQKHLFAQALLGCGVKCFGAPTREWTLLDFAQSCRLHKVTSRWSLTRHATNDSPLSPPVPSLRLFVSLSLSLRNICHEAGKSFAPTVPLPDSGARLPASPPAFSAPLNLIAASLYRRSAPLIVPLPGYPAMQQHLLERQRVKRGQCNG